MCRGTKPPFEIGDEVIFVEDPAPTQEHVANVKWIDAPIPHWRIETIWHVGDQEHHRIADADEFHHACASSQVVSL
jgi:hypothetical protein